MSDWEALYRAKAEEHAELASRIYDLEMRCAQANANAMAKERDSDQLRRLVADLKDAAARHVCACTVLDEEAETAVCPVPQERWCW